MGLIAFLKSHFNWAFNEAFDISVKIVSVILLFSPLLFFQLSYEGNIDITIGQLLLIIAMPIAIFWILPENLIKEFLPRWDYWQRTTLVLVFFSIGNGFLIFHFMKNTTSEIELLKNSVLFLGAILVVVPSSIKNLMAIFPDNNTSRDRLK